MSSQHSEEKTLPNRNGLKTLVFMLENEGKPLSVAEMINLGLRIPKSSLFATMDMLLEGYGHPLVKLVQCRDGRTSFRFSLTSKGTELATQLL